MTLDALAGRLSPDVPVTFRRFPLAILMTGLATLILIGAMTGVLQANSEMWGRLTAGLATGAIFATGGALFAETRKSGSILGLFAAWAVPLLAAAAWQVTSTGWLIPFALPVIGTLWTSVAATTGGWRGAARLEAQDRFWWLNHLAITSAAIVGVAYLIVLIGTYAIGQSIHVLFGVNLELPLYRVALPAIGGFFAPLYWLSTLPRAADYQPGRLDAPDFLVRAVAMIGKFILIPLLLAYAAILLAYAAQIVVTQQLPQGMLGWMVLGFVTAGAAAWLVLYPEFVGNSVIVRFFHRWWFWATVVPLVLYFTAVQVRLDAYGFTEERLLLIWGGVWATALTALFLLRRGDIRLIPAIAAVCLLLATVGPWNVVGLSRTQQSATFDNLLPLTGPNGESYGITPTWTPEEAAKARGAVDYLAGSEEGREAIRRILFYKGFDFDLEYFNTSDVMATLGVAEASGVSSYDQNLMRDTQVPVDVASAPFYVGNISLYRNGGDTILLGLGFSLEGKSLRVSRDGAVIADTDLTPWFETTAPFLLANPAITFEVEGRRFLLLAESIALVGNAESDATGATVASVYGQLFAGPEVTPPAPPPAAETTAQDPPAPAT